MGFKKLDIKPEYRSFQDDLINDFYVPVLTESITYQRAVGYFSSTALLEITKGLKEFVKNKGKIQIIASPELSKEDIEALEMGYKKRDEIISNRIVETLDLEELNAFEKERFNILAWLIKNNILEIKLAFIETKSGIGIYHEKMGIVKDEEGNTIVFTGSMNETGAALSHNYESIDIFKSWDGDSQRVALKEEAFQKLWENDMGYVKTISFPEVAKDKLKTYLYAEPNFDVDIEEGLIEPEKVEPLGDYTGPELPEDLKIRDYQENAIEKWAEDNYQGIFDMATGTGKTITSLAAATKLFEDNNKRLAIVIVAPYQHLVDQWVDDIEWFGMNPIIGHSASPQRSWRSQLSNQVDGFNYELIDHFCFVTTNATYRSDFAQEMLKKLESDYLLIVDEAHNFGAEYLSRSLAENAPYRLALSATINRHNDEEGTARLYDYFGQKSIEYTLKDAIDNDMLTPYYYYPIPVHLTEEELEDYQKLTAEIGKRITKDRHGKVKFTESAKFYLIKRAQLIAGASNKLSALREQMKEKTDETHVLVYSGATTIADPNYVEGDPNNEEIRQIDAVTDILGNELNMNVSQFTSKENMAERRNLQKRFANNEDLQALIAIRCLDEGVDIPSIKSAFILASSTNPKEYIQRRGRVLRKYEGKQYAEIYDFITLPYPLEELEFIYEEELAKYKGLVARELMRMRDFAAIAENSSHSDALIYELEDRFELFETEEEENVEKYI